MTKLGRLQIFISIGLLVGLSFMTSPAVWADHFTGPGCAGLPSTSTSAGRCYEDGYFTGQFKTPIPGGFIWPDGLDVNSFTTDGTLAVNSAATFIARVQTRLNVDLTGCDLNPVFLPAGDPCIMKKRHAIGAGFLIHAMLGNPGTNFTGVADGIAQAKAQFGAWAARINLYESTGSILWNEILPTPAGEPDWYGDLNGRDVYWSVFSQPPEPTVVFINPDGSQFLILRKCANPKGLLPPLEPPPPLVNGDWEYQPSTSLAPSSPTIALPGSDVIIRGVTSNSGDATGPAYEQTIHVSSGGAFLTNGGDRNFNFVTGIPNGGTGGNQDETFSISATAPPGAIICFVTITTPTAGTVTNGVISVTDSGSVTSPPVCVTLAEAPYVKIYGNDIWAGALMENYLVNPECQPPQPPVPEAGAIRGVVMQDDAGDYQGAVTEYGAFALFDIESFGTANLPGSALLAFANTFTPAGNFTVEDRCISDFFERLKPHVDLYSFGLDSALTSNSTDGLQLLFSGDQVADPSFGAGNPFNKRMTILVEGDLTIRKNIEYDPDYGTVASPNIPILVFIVKGDITIDEKVERLDGIYISSGTINTCSDADPLSVNVCNNPFGVHGSFIAKRVDFRRTHGGVGLALAGDPNHECDNTVTGSTGPKAYEKECAAEILLFKPEIYLANPVFKDGSSDDRFKIQQIRDLPPTF